MEDGERATTAAEEEPPMVIQQYDYTACCTGFLQQLPSFLGDPTKTDEEGQP